MYNVGDLYLLLACLLWLSPRLCLRTGAIGSVYYLFDLLTLHVFCCCREIAAWK